MFSPSLLLKEWGPIFFDHVLPPLPKFSGDTPGEEEDGVKEWLERLEMIASACAWSEQVRSHD